ncbi:MAG: hypothetical protein O7B35_17010, partial [Deltaproteobacteria bacterium]|nr:hypothetical protein [Deltaproteobacteria bacterium]
PGETTVAVTVTDSGCTNIPLVGADVILSSTFVPGSGGHAHIEVEREGTGKFFMGDSEIGKTVEGLITDEEGKIPEFTYKAGIVGLKETINAEVMFKEEMVTGEAELTIAIEGLSPLPDSEEYILTGSTSRHLLNNHYAADGMEFRILNLARLFRAIRTQLFGLTGGLKINDISLPNGGVFDLCGDLTTCPGEEKPFKGHSSHEIGIDVDIESTDSNNVSIVGQRHLLRIFAREMGCRNIGPTHHRCDRPIIGQIAEP